MTQNKEKMPLGAILRETVGDVRRVLSLISWKQQLIFWPSMAIYTLQNAILNTAMSWLVGQVVAAATMKSISLLGQSIALFAGIFLVFLALLCMAVYWQLKNQDRLLNRMLEMAYTRLLTMPMSRMGKAGEAFSRLENDVPAAAQMGGMNLAGMVLMQPMTGLGASIVIGAVHPLLLITALAGGIVSLVVQLVMVQPNRRANDEIRVLQAEKTVQLDDLIAGGLTVRLFGRQQTMNGKMWDSLLAIARAQMKTYKLGVLSALGVGVSEWLTMAGVAVVGLWLAMRGTIT